MHSRVGDAETGNAAPPVDRRHAETEYCRLLAILIGRARRLGSTDWEGAAQEALKRSLENENSRPAVEFYFREHSSVELGTPEWPLDRLLAWLHGVLNYVVREEHSRARNGREVSFDRVGVEASSEPRLLEPRDPSPDQLEVLIQRETQEVVLNAFPQLDSEYRAVLQMRMDGLTYTEIASRLGVNENTVATWVSRGIRTLGQYVRRRTKEYTRFPQALKQGGPRA
jgi:RNA polymerase sigma factor (sigma-70 family)